MSCHERERDCSYGMFRLLIIVMKGLDFQFSYFTVDCDLEIVGQLLLFLFITLRKAISVIHYEILQSTQLSVEN